jgi:cytochrome c553
MNISRSTASYFRRRPGLLTVSAAIAVCGFFSQVDAVNQMAAGQPPPYWAYVVNPPEPPGASAKPPDNTPVHVPDSAATFTVAQTQDFFAPPDWHPADHPAMPKIVAAGRAPEVFACGYCHLPNGQGRPENASLAGLPAAYIAQQMADFKSGQRKSSEPKHGPTTAMIGVAAKANDDEIQAAAKYFSALKPRPWIRVVETDTVPKTHVAGWMLVVNHSAKHDSAKNDSEKMEPIGRRIIETPENLEHTELRDDHSGFIAYVPRGSLKRGEALVKTGGDGKTVPCSACHGTDLKGLDKAPPLAGRSPSYIVRQLYDIQSGARHGVATQVMTSTVTKLTIGDMVAIAAYTASLKP